MSRIAVLAIAAWCALAAAPGRVLAQEDVEALAERHNCFNCHRVDQKWVGPAFREVARRYKDDPQAMERLARKVRRGGSGNWGTVSMPSNDVSDGDLRVLLRWVLKTSG